MNQLQRVSGFAAILEAAIYIVAFIYFGAFWAYPSAGDPLEQMLFLSNNQVPFTIINSLMYILFGVLLAVLVAGLYERLKDASPSLVQVGSLFGAVWVGLVIASGMISNIGLQSSLSLMTDSAERAFDTWIMVSLLTESLGGGNELVGGLWVLLTSLGALKGKVFSKTLNYLGLVVGIAGIATIYPADILTEVFGITQIIWFFFLGVSLIRQKK